MKGRRIAAEIRERCVQLLLEGLRPCIIARRLGLTDQSVHTIKKQYLVGHECKAGEKSL